MHTNPIVMLHTDNPDEARAVLIDHHPDLTIHTCDTYGDLPTMLAETQASVVYSVRFWGTASFPRKALVESETVKWVSVGGSGTDHLLPWNKDLVTVTNAAGVAADMMAQYVLGTMLHFSLNLDSLLVAKRNREWLMGKVEPIDGKTALIVGLGPTGIAVARLCKAMGLKTLGVRARPKKTPHVDEIHSTNDLRQLWPRADYIVLCVPLLETTRGLVGKDAFELMKPEAVLVDVSRGGVVDEPALISALDEERIRGAALDVFAEEPLPAEHPLWSYDKVIISPHCSSVYDGWETKSVRMFAENLSRYRAGQQLANIINPAIGY
ncbi:MAG: D-2-hydroxyacid dehydrogenase [Pseudomonadota bacterium]